MCVCVRERERERAVWSILQCPFKCKYSDGNSYPSGNYVTRDREREREKKKILQGEIWLL